MLPLSTATNERRPRSSDRGDDDRDQQQTAAAGASRPERFRVTYGIGDGNGLRLSPVGEVRDGDLGDQSPKGGPMARP